MHVRKLIKRRIRDSDRAIDVAADVNAVISANVGERDTTTPASGTQRVDRNAAEREGQRVRR